MSIENVQNLQNMSRHSSTPIPDDLGCQSERRPDRIGKPVFSPYYVDEYSLHSSTKFWNSASCYQTFQYAV